jgi:hypothetical protein
MSDVFFHPTPTPVLNQHYVNIEESLNHRLEVAKSENNTHLVALLEREREQIRQQAQVDGVVAPEQNWLQRTWQQVVAALTDSTLQVWQAADDMGNLWWCAYDPQTGKSVYADTETEMRLWIQQNYHGR